MKHFFRSLIFVAAAATLFVGCSKSDEQIEIPGAPTMVWEGNDLEAVHEITDPMSVQIDIAIPGGLQKLQLEIESPALTPELLGMVGLATKMELTNPATPAMEEALKKLNIPAGSKIKGSTQLTFDISTLVPMIKALYQEDSDHNFKVIVTDAANQSISKTLRFHLTDGPSITWEGKDINAVHEITDPMSILINIAIPGAIEKLELQIESPALTPELLGMVGLATQMDLTNPASPAMEEGLKELGLPAGAALKGLKEQLFDISALVPMIKAIYQESSLHIFKLKITDKLGNVLEQSLQFHLTGPSSIAYNNDADLWKNTATLTAVVRAEGAVTVEYRKKGATDWQQATVAKSGEKTYTATIAPTWKAEGNHATGVAQFSLNSNTGIFAGSTYEYRLLAAGIEMDKKEFKAAAGQAIPFGDMNTWSKYIGFNPEWVGNPTYDEYKVDYPNQNAEEAFWSNGNNAFATTLCTPAVYNDASPANKYAQLKGNAAMGVIFAAGNLFSGVFELPAMAGYARFGQKYEFTARPSAIKVRIKTTINTITMLHPDNKFPLPEAAKVGNTDPSRIFVCITDWDNRHSVYSGLGVKPEELNAFDPVADKAEPIEGKVIAYGSKTFTQSVADWQEIIIPILYKDKESKPASGKYSLVISCASSAYGDYLCGCPDNVLSVDDFQWVY